MRHGGGWNVSCYCVRHLSLGGQTSWRMCSRSLPSTPLATPLPRCALTGAAPHPVSSAHHPGVLHAPDVRPAASSQIVRPSCVLPLASCPGSAPLPPPTAPARAAGRPSTACCRLEAEYRCTVLTARSPCSTPAATMLPIRTRRGEANRVAHRCIRFAARKLSKLGGISVSVWTQSSWLADGGKRDRLRRGRLLCGVRRECLAAALCVVDSIAFVVRRAVYARVEGVAAATAAEDTATHHCAMHVVRRSIIGVSVIPAEYPCPPLLLMPMCELSYVRCVPVPVRSARTCTRTRAHADACMSHLRMCRAVPSASDRHSVWRLMRNAVVVVAYLVSRKQLCLVFYPPSLRSRCGCPTVTTTTFNRHN